MSEERENSMPGVPQKDASSASKGVSIGDLDYMSDASAAMLIKTPRGGRIILWAAFLFVVAAVAWASWAELDEVTSGMGKVIPSSQIQVVQNLEGGIVAELLVKPGQTVEQNQVLLRIDDTRFSSSLRETRQHYLALLAKRSRLQSEASGESLTIPKEVLNEAKDLAEEEKGLYDARRSELKNNQSIIEEQVAQRSQELRELKSRQQQLSRSFGLLSKELKMTQPLVAAGAISEVEVLRLERQANELQGELDGVRLSIPRIRSQLEEAQKKADEVELRFRSAAREQLSEVNAELSQLQESSVALEDRVERTAVRSPVKGTIKQVLVTTVGGVIQPGMELVEIVPLEDTLLIEAKVSPKDIGFLHPGQVAIVKFTAYDFAIFGGLEGELEHISADTITDENDESYYLVKVRTDRNYLGTEKSPLSIIPGMLTEVDVVTGKKTVLQYLMKPVLRARSKAMRER